MEQRMPAEGFAPGEFIAEELEERGWSQADLADILGKTPAMVNELIKGKRGITPETGEGLAGAFGTSAEYWTSLETAYQYWMLRKTQTRPLVSHRKAKLMSVAPYRELMRRGWIQRSGDIDVLEEQVLAFFGTDRFEDTMSSVMHAARRSTSYAEVSPALSAWLCRARQIAKGLHVEPFSKARLQAEMEKLKPLRQNCEEIRLIPQLLAEAGVRLVIVEHLTGTKVDGACLWLDDGSPVIALSIRYDRIDSFWHTLMHEIGHAINGDGDFVDSNLVGDDAASSDQKPVAENSADEYAVEFLVPQRELRRFVNNHAPLYYPKDIQGFSLRIGVHSGIVVGQLQHSGELEYYQYRKMLEKIRHIITDAALTDGWGSVVKVV
ncbi:MAG: helix-turn-helix domain-containing protein [Chloroflexi bacterium]|nr:helix-turn-helix domain-containing protein [Chloroflexota bacterium]